MISYYIINHYLSKEKISSSIIMIMRWEGYQSTLDGSDDNFNFNMTMMRMHEAIFILVLNVWKIRICIWRKMNLSN